MVLSDKQLRNDSRQVVVQGKSIWMTPLLQVNSSITSVEFDGVEGRYVLVP